MNLVKILLIITGLAACSTTSSKRSTSDMSRPEWIESPFEFCGEEKLCAVGEADGYLQAELVARDNLAKIFETKVQSESVYELENKSKIEEEVVSGLTEEDSNRRIKENTELVLEGVQIIKKYRDDEASYVLAVLEKSKAAKIFKKRINLIDEQIYSQYQRNKRSSLAKAVKLVKIRETLHDRYLIIRNIKISPKVSFEKIVKRRDDLVSVGTVLLFEIEKDNKFKSLNDLIIQKLLDLGYRVITDSARDYEFKIKSEIKIKESFLNVKGFKKFKVTNTLTSTDRSDKKIGSLFLENEDVGRSRSDSVEKSLQKIGQKIIEQIDELNID